MKGITTMFVLVAACSSNKPNPGGPVDANNNPPLEAFVYMDAPPNVMAMITISGTAAEQGLGSSTPQQGVAVSIFATSNESTPLGTAMTDAQGKYSIMVATNGHAVDGFIKATKSGYMDTYSYPAGPWDADAAMSDLNMITPGNFSALSSFAGGNQMMGKGVIALGVLDASSMPVTGATVESSPASNPYRYDGSGGIPSSSATSTSSDGFAFMFNVPGQVTITAAKAGATFKSHPVNAHPDAFTMTVVTE